MDLDVKSMKIAGKVKAVLFKNEGNGYTVIRLEDTDGESVTAVGILPCVSVGEELILTGRMSVHPAYGEQFKAEFAQRQMPRGKDAIYEFLASGAVKGVGPATATLLVTEFGDRTLEVIERQPQRMAGLRGISERKAREISESYKKQIGIRRLMELLGNHGIRPVYAIRLYRTYGDEAVDLLNENPYIITREAVGASFAEADQFALEYGFDEDSPERVEAALIFVLKHNTRNGHCFIPLEKLVGITSGLISVPPEPIEEAMEVLIDDGSLVRCAVAGKDACYLASLYDAEVYITERVREMSAKPLPEPAELDALIAAIEEEHSVTYAALQTYSLKVAATRRIMVLTGGPGTGKTTTVRAIVSLFDRLGLNTELTAPTGRAAKRMSELSGKEAQTVHRLLEAGSPEGGDEMVFRKNENDKLKCGAIILDECSMVDITLFRALLCAMPEDCRLVLVGDADQLPSVGPGNVFNDIIRSGIVETVRLTEIFRQTSASRIVAGAHMINRGDYPDLSANSSGSDLFFLRRVSAAQAVETVLELCSSRLPGNMGIPVSDIQVLSPTRRGEAGTGNLNMLLQQKLNPPAAGRKEKIFGELSFRQGDRVMQIRNNYDIIWYKPEKIRFEEAENAMPVPRVALGDKPGSGLGVYNGDVGFISDIDYANELMYVLYDDRLAVYGYEQLSELEHAYAMTVHKAQGSEYRAVIFVALEGAPQLMSRKVLYTAVTRAQRLLVIVGNDRAVYGMIENHKLASRYSGLRARLVELEE